ncbi:mitochondrial substrate carrier family protein [Wolffia australiana]
MAAEVDCSRSREAPPARSWRRGDMLGNFQRDLLAGALMGGFVHTVVAPIERAKLLLQTQESNAAIVGLGGPSRRRRFRGMIDCFKRTVKEEGVLALWRGNGIGVIRYYPSVALNFSFKDLYRSMLRSTGQPSEGSSSITSAAMLNFAAGAAAGCTTLIIIYPLDIAHTRLAADVGALGSRQFRGTCHFLCTIMHNDGIRGIYRGLPASLQGMILHRGLYFGGFDTAKELLSPPGAAARPLWQHWLAAQATTSIAGIVSYPLDTVRRHMMMQSGTNNIMYISTADCWRKIYRAEGASGFYRGGLSHLFRSVGAASILVLYDEVKKLMH